MRIDFRNIDGWEEFNQSLSTRLGGAERGVAYLAYGSHLLALTDVSLGLIKQFPHKKKILMFKGSHPSLESLATVLAREGADLNFVAPALISQPETWSEQIPKDLLAVIWAHDDPLFGSRVEDHAFIEFLTKSRIFSVRLSHHNFVYEERVPLDRHRIQVLSCSMDLALIEQSQRLVWPSYFGMGQAFGEADLNVVQQVFSTPAPLVGRTREFEDRLKSLGAKPIFDISVARLEDRASVYWPDMDGWALLTELGPELQQQLATTSLNFWGGLKSMDWLRPMGFNDEMIRGTVMIPVELCTDKLYDEIKKARQVILTKQGMV